MKITEIKLIKLLLNILPNYAIICMGFVLLKNLLNKTQLTVSKIEELIPKLKGRFFNLMNGKNSNYIMSELIQNASKKQKLIILSEIYNQIDILAINEYGSHPLQALIEKASK